MCKRDQKYLGTTRGEIEDNSAERSGGWGGGGSQSQ